MDYVYTGMLTPGVTFFVSEEPLSQHVDADCTINSRGGVDDGSQICGEEG